MKERKKTIRQWRVYSSLFSFIFVIVIAYSCSDDISKENHPKEVHNKELTRDYARAWYLEQYGSVTAMKVLDTFSESLVIPQWECAKEFNNDEWEVVEAPLDTEHLGVLMDAETRIRVNWEIDHDKIKNITRMIITKNLQTQEINHFVMICIGSYEYLITSETFLENNYLHREPDYDGTIFFVKPNVGLLNGWIYENGKISWEILNERTDNDSNRLTRSHQSPKPEKYCWEEREYSRYKCADYPSLGKEIFFINGDKTIRDCPDLEEGGVNVVCNDGNEVPPNDHSFGGASDPNPEGFSRVQVQPTILKEWAEEDESPRKLTNASTYSAKVKWNLPTTMKKHSVKTAMFGLMEYISSDIYDISGKPRLKSYYEAEYIKKYKKQIPDTGVDFDEVFGFVNEHFVTRKGFRSVSSAIKSGHIIIMDFYDGWTYGEPTYPVLVVDCTPYGNLIYMDPVKGELYTMTKMGFQFNYAMCIWRPR